MDEATASLDIQHTSQILRLVRQRVREEQLTVAAVIHDINLAFSVCDEILFVAAERILGPAVPTELITEETLSEIYGIARDRITVHTSPRYLECRL
jgi:iron complex transport system ATP-binding protein